MGSPAVNDTLIALGANLAHCGAAPAETLGRALAALAADPDIAVTARSALYRTPALPAGSGPDFVNAAARLDTALAPEAVLDRLHAIEARSVVRVRRAGRRDPAISTCWRRAPRSARTGRPSRAGWAWLQRRPASRRRRS